MKKNNKAKKLIVFVLCTIFFFIIFTIIIANDYSNFQFKKRIANYVEGEILVKFKQGTAQSTIMTTMNILGVEKKKGIGKGETLLFKLKNEQNIDNAIAEFMDDPNVEYAQPNYIYRIMTTSPNDPKYSKLWALKNYGQYISDPVYNTNNPGTSGKDLDMELAWDAITDCSSIIVAVIDSGINYNHQDLSTNMWNGSLYHGYDFVDDDSNPMDYNGHGTHCAGVIGSRGNNNIGTTGVCWKVQLMAVRVMDATGYGTTANIISGIYYAVDHNANILSMSLGGPAYDQAHYDAIEYAQDNGVLVVVAAGNENNDNDGGTHTYPCDFDLDNIIGVAALDQSYELADFSNYGSISVDVGAPGTNILSEWCGEETIIEPSLSSGWSEGGTLGWAYGVRDLGSGNIPLLLDPSDWGPPNWGYYNSNAQDTIWKTFNLLGNDIAILSYFIWMDLESGYDGFYCVVDDVAGDPFIIDPYYLAAWTGSTNGYFYQDQWEIPDDYITSTCTIGFGLWSDGTVQYNGVAITGVYITAIDFDNYSYKLELGTSMATPYVAGLTALVWALNPDYDYKDVIDAIEYGGETVSDLSGKTTTGKAINAWGSIKYIKKPTGVTITK